MTTSGASTGIAAAAGLAARRRKWRGARGTAVVARGVATVLACAVLAASLAPAQAQTTLPASIAGSAFIDPASYSTGTSGVTFNLGFGVEYLIVGGNGGSFQASPDELPVIDIHSL